MGSPCDPTCEKPQPRKGFCIRVCKERYYCPTGYLIKEGTSTCVRESVCQAQFRDNQQGSPGPQGPQGPRGLPYWDTCGSYYDRTCDNPKRDPDMGRIKLCKAGWKCPSGYLIRENYDRNVECVLASQCFREAG